MPRKVILMIASIRHIEEIGTPADLIKQKNVLELFASIKNIPWIFSKFLQSVF